MEIVAGLFVEALNFREIEGGFTRIDITGAFFTQPLPEFPASLEPHLVVLVHEPVDGTGQATLVTEFFIGDDVVARNVQPVAVEPGKFGYRLVRPQLEIPGPETIVTRCEIPESGSRINIPLQIVAQNATNEV